MAAMHAFIIVKGEPKALQIDKIDLDKRGVYRITFKNSPTPYSYRREDVVLLKEAVWHDHLLCKVYVQGRELYNIADIRSFKQGNKKHWRITHDNGFVKDYLDGTINVIESCLSSEEAINALSYFKRIAQTNELGKQDISDGILSYQYAQIDFIDKDLAIAPYLNPAKHKIKSRTSSTLMFPFGCNASQEKAVTKAFEHQLSVIQGPPGTGKTQTILNIIANLLMQDKTVIVVSNNNSAITNVLEKLQKYDMDFIVASLGRKENKEAFILNQPPIPKELVKWKCFLTDSMKKKREVSALLRQLRSAFAWQEELALLKQERQTVELEWEHFKLDHHVDETTYSVSRHVKSSKLMQLWLQYQAYIEKDMMAPRSFFDRLKERIKWIWMNMTRKYILKIQSPFDANSLGSTIIELQALYYQVRLSEIRNRITEIELNLKSTNSKSITERLTCVSMELLKGHLYNKYHKSNRTIYPDVKALKLFADDICKQYPIILSTTFSARTSLSDTTVYDYLIMDEASQVSIETGALALTCARNAVIVGDSLQLPNVVTNDDKLKFANIFKQFKIHKGYDCGENSFLSSICSILPDVPQTLLREHYRCHPKIINFCNQKFYGGNLLIMTQDHNEEHTMQAIKTVPGNHARGHYNQREIDVILQEVLPSLAKDEDVGIIAPYNPQVDQLNRQIPSIEAATVHKYQGREKDTIIMSIVDDQITAFSDDPNLLNVAISRAKKRFCLVVSGNKQESKGNISELVDYIEYNNFKVSDSKVRSIFDYLYSHYTDQRMAIIANNPKISAYDSENLTFAFIRKILSAHQEFSHLGVLCHIPLRHVIRDSSLMSEEERTYATHYSTHLDFLIINHVSKKSVLAIETDGYSFHNDSTEQHKRDVKKNHILELYGLPLLRLSTIGSGEEEKIVTCLRRISGSITVNND